MDKKYYSKYLEKGIYTIKCISYVSIVIYNTGFHIYYWNCLKLNDDQFKLVASSIEHNEYCIIWGKQFGIARRCIVAQAPVE